ncbi:CSLREA domain-containing protein [Candidatus Acetothermia bacterium]|nr:CSLREA domain-containing protein [Candidatus Acetothermia bacterium]
MQNRFLLLGLSRLAGRLSGILAVALLALCVGFTQSALAAIIDVDTTNDETQWDGNCSLREAILSANSDLVVDSCKPGSGTDTINIPGGTYVLQIPGTNEDGSATGDLDITHALNLIGAGAAATLIDGGAIDRVFHIIGKINVNIVGVTIQNGNGAGEEGGGIFNPLGTLRVQDCILSNNIADFGGAISSQGTLELVNTTIGANSRIQADPSGLLNGGDARLSNSTITSNTQSAIRNTGRLKITQSLVTNNSVGGGGGSGGGVYNTGSLEITESTFSGNSAVGRGGAIFNSGISAVVTISNSTLSANRGKSGGGILNDQGQVTLKNVILSDNIGGLRGGGISNENGGKALITESQFTSNRAFAGGGLANVNAISTLTNVTLSENEALSGGAIANAGTLSLSSSTVSANTARVNGGGIINIGNLTLVNVTMSGNSAVNDGGAIENAGEASLINVTIALSTAVSGGGIANTSSITLKNTIVADSLSGGDCSGSITSAGHNLDSDGTCGLAALGDLSALDPRLGLLQENGGPTFTQALLSGSPAIDAADNSGCPATDQRGSHRPTLGFPGSTLTCDIGAYEFGAPVVLMPLVGGDPPIWRDVMVFPTPEAAHGADLNGDGDLDDTVLRYKDLSTGQVVNTGISVSGRHRDTDIYDDDIVFVQRENSLLDRIMSLFNPSGRIGLYNIRTGESKILDLWGSKPSIYGNIISVSGSNVSYYDLNTATLVRTKIVGTNQSIWGKSIAYESVPESSEQPEIYLYNIETGAVTDSGAIGSEPAIENQIVTFETKESDVGKDLNGDGDATDTVIRYYNLATRKTQNTQMAGGDPAVYGNHIVFSQDKKILYYDIADHQGFSTGELGTEPDIYEDRITFFVWESWKLRDMNLDGDQKDPIVGTHTISDSDKPIRKTPHVEIAAQRRSAIHQLKLEQSPFVITVEAQGANIESTQLEVFDLNGVLIYQSGFSADQKMSWTMKNKSGARVANGVYLYRVTARGMNGQLIRSQMKMFLLLR